MVATEVILPNGRRAAVIGISADGQVTIIKVKVSTQDYLKDNKWREYLVYSDEFYFCLDYDYRPLSSDKSAAGYIVGYKNGIKLIASYKLERSCAEREQILFTVGR